MQNKGFRRVVIAGVALGLLVVGAATSASRESSDAQIGVDEVPEIVQARAIGFVESSYEGKVAEVYRAAVATLAHGRA